MAAFSLPMTAVTYFDSLKQDTLTLMRSHFSIHRNFTCDTQIEVDLPQ
ncbi:hypothetical protein [Tolypothrix sp. VBCCA 56010]